MRRSKMTKEIKRRSFVKLLLIILPIIGVNAISEVAKADYYECYYECPKCGYRYSVDRHSPCRNSYKCPKCYSNMRLKTSIHHTGTSDKYPAPSNTPKILTPWEW